MPTPSTGVTARTWPTMPPVLTAGWLESRLEVSYLLGYMTATPRPTWLVRVALACLAMACMWLAGASMADRPLLPMPQSVHDTGASRIILESAARALVVSRDAPTDHVSARPVSTTRPAWQRSGGRRTHRTASSQISSVERPLGMVGGAAFHERGGLSATSRLAVFHRDGRLGSAPTRAPPNHR